MIENLKIALKRQKKLIIIFLLTILIPSVSLSIFGIRAIRNERFRLAKQTENEHRRAADFLKAQINSRFEDVEEVLQNLAQNPAFHEKEYSTIRDLLGRTDLLIPVTKMGKNAFKMLGLKCTDNIYNGIEIDKMCNDPFVNRQTIFGPLIQNDDFLFMTMGINNERKKIDVLLEAFAKFLQKMEYI